MAILPVTAERRSLSRRMIRSALARRASSLAVSVAMWDTMARCSEKIGDLPDEVGVVVVGCHGMAGG